MKGKDEFIKMKHELTKINNLLYQYRPCRRDENTIYDIENIRHSVVYAQTPLNMNDPFDSKIGFDSEKIYDELIKMVLDIYPMDQNIKKIFWFLLHFDLLGQMVEFLSALNELKKIIINQRKAMHKENMPLKVFINENVKLLYNKLTKQLKGYFPKETLPLFGAIIVEFENVEITEKNLTDILGLSDKLELTKKGILELQNERYVPAINHFLSLLTVSCFSASGWQNSLMWSHYANSYKGFCVEYNFRQMDTYIGYVGKIKYDSKRPTISLKDVGIYGVSVDSNEDGTTSTKIVNGDVKINQIIEYLLVKSTCWKYEEEWRIINIEEKPDTPRFVQVPRIESVTFGVNMDYLCRQLLWDVCKEKDIPCYELSLGISDFSINRKQLTDADFEFDFEKENKYILMLFETFAKNSEKMKVKGEAFHNMVENKEVDCFVIEDLDISFIDCLTDIYFLKNSVVRIFNKCSSLEKQEVPDEFLTLVTNIDQYIAENKTMPIEQRKALNAIFMAGKMNVNEYRKINQMVSKIDSLLEKIDKLEWPKLLLKKI